MPPYRCFQILELSNDNIRSQEVSKDLDKKPVNFEEVALDTTKDVFEEFYAPWSVPNSTYLLKVFLNSREFGERVFSDLEDTWWMIGIALIGACFLSFIWIILKRFMTGFMVWGSILIVFLGTGGALGYCSYRLYFTYMDQDPIAQTSIVEVRVGEHTKTGDILYN